MDLNQISLFKMANRQMDYLNERQKVLAQNIANANTPDYMPKDLQEPSFSQILKNNQKSKLAVTNSAHISGAVPKLAMMQTDQVNIGKPQESSAFKIIKTKPYEVSPDNNGVILEEQMAKVGETKSAYDKVTQIYKSYMSLIKTTISRS
jgi:flagellar basal-body rod protein FlgB